MKCDDSPRDSRDCLPAGIEQQSEIQPHGDVPSRGGEVSSQIMEYIYKCAADGRPTQALVRKFSIRPEISPPWMWQSVRTVRCQRIHHCAATKATDGPSAH